MVTPPLTSTVRATCTTQADAAAAKPKSAQEARELEQAEAEGKSHSKGER